MADNDKKHVEIDEVQEFAGGEVKSIEPLAEGDTEHGVHGSFHEYSGGQIIERTDTQLSPLYIVGMWTLLILIVATLIFSGVIPWFHPFGGYGRPEGTTNSGYAAVAGQMKDQASQVVLTSPALIDMYLLPRPQGQDLDQAIKAGTDVYQTYCIGCHGPNQDGAGPNSVSLDPKPRNLRNVDFVQAMSYQRIWTSVHKGVPGTAMPRWENTLSDDQIRDVICYVFSLTAPTDPKTGKFIRPSPQDLGSQATSQGQQAYGTAAPPQ